MGPPQKKQGGPEDSLSTPIANRGMKGIHFDTVEKRNEESAMITFEEAGKKYIIGSGLRGFNKESAVGDTAADSPLKYAASSIDSMSNNYLQNYKKFIVDETLKKKMGRNKTFSTTTKQNQLYNNS